MESLWPPVQGRWPLQITSASQREPSTTVHINSKQQELLNRYKANVDLSNSVLSDCPWMKKKKERKKERKARGEWDGSEQQPGTDDREVISGGAGGAGVNMPLLLQLTVSSTKPHQGVGGLVWSWRGEENEWAQKNGWMEEREWTNRRVKGRRESKWGGEGQIFYGACKTGWKEERRGDEVCGGSE